WPPASPPHLPLSLPLPLSPSSPFARHRLTRPRRFLHSSCRSRPRELVTVGEGRFFSNWFDIGWAGTSRTRIGGLVDALRTCLNVSCIPFKQEEKRGALADIQFILKQENQNLLLRS
ncbi:unnamed protein product, partial [Urochloa humidicola]